MEDYFIGFLSNPVLTPQVIKEIIVGTKTSLSCQTRELMLKYARGETEKRLSSLRRCSFSSMQNEV